MGEFNAGAQGLMGISKVREVQLNKMSEIFYRYV
jgi:hypothetical protein